MTNESITTTAMPKRSATSPRGMFMIFIVAVLGGVAGYAMLHEVRKEAPVVAAPQVNMGHGGMEMGQAPRPAMSADEERYAHALWQIHDQVRSSAVKMTFAGLAYKMGDTDKDAMRAKVKPLINVFQEAQGRIKALNAPPSMVALHKEYEEAIGLYAKASAEMTRPNKQGDDQHLIVAHEMSEKASTLLLKVGETLWPGEYKPN